MSIDLRIVESIEDFENLHDEWNLLYADVENTTIFNSWDWMYTWWDVFHHKLTSSLHIICLYEDSTLIGVAPFQISTSFPKSLVQGRTVSFIGCGEAADDKVVSQYMDFLVLEHKQDLMITEVSKYLSVNKHIWDFADFEFLLENALVSKCFQLQGCSVKTSLCSYGKRFSISDLSSFEEDFLPLLGNRWRKMLRKKMRKLEESGEVSIETSPDAETAKQAFLQLKKMHEARWENRSHINIFQSECFTDFHLKIMERLASQGKANIAILRVDDEPLAAYYYFTDKKQRHYYQSGFFKEKANRYSPLFLLVCREIESAIDENLLFDFMFDENESSYKKVQYAASSSQMYRFMCSPYKSRFLRYTIAKGTQNFYLRLRGSLIQSDCKGN